MEAACHMLEFWSDIRNCALEEVESKNPPANDPESLLKSYDTVIDNLYPLNIKSMINYIESNHMGSNPKPEQRARLRVCAIKIGLEEQKKQLLTQYRTSIDYSSTPDPESSSFNNPVPVFFGEIVRRDKAFFERMEKVITQILESHLSDDQLEQVKAELGNQTSSETRLDFLTLMLEKIAGIKL